MTTPRLEPEPAIASEAPSDDVARRIAQYEAWAQKLEGTLADYVRRTPTYRRFYYGLTTAGFACFAFGAFPGIWGSMSGTFVSLGGYAMLRTRIWELKVEIAETRDEIERLRTGRVTARRRPLW